MTHATWICSKCDTTYECGSPCRLHAAAPKLLEALEQFVAKWPAGRVSEESLRLARAAIKAAKDA